MTRLIIVVGLILVCVVGLGFYFGYFKIGSDSTDGATHITLTVDLLMAVKNSASSAAGSVP